MKVLLTVLILSITMKGYSCSCNDDRPISECVKSALAIFSGSVVSQTFAKTEHETWFIYKVKIYKFFKGKVKTGTVNVWTRSEGTACGIKFKVKSQIIVYALHMNLDYWHGITNDRNAFFTNVCTRSGIYSKSAEKNIIMAI